MDSLPWTELTEKATINDKLGSHKYLMHGKSIIKQNNLNFTVRLTDIIKTINNQLSPHRLVFTIRARSNSAASDILVTLPNSAPAVYHGPYLNIFFMES